MPMEDDPLSSNSHRRRNPLTAAWVLCAPHRATRPWLGQVEPTVVSTSPVHDPKCYLCPSNTRISGHLNPAYQSTYVFRNDFQAVKSDQPGLSHKIDSGSDLLQAQMVRGTCEVWLTPNTRLCALALTITRRSRVFQEVIVRSYGSVDEILSVIQAWKEVYTRLSKLDFINLIQIFENKGEIMGCSNPHPHGQVWATEHVPEEPSKELLNMMKYKETHGTCMLCDYCTMESTGAKPRLVCENASFVCVVPYWAVWYTLEFNFLQAL
jgi:UDPglucose--hexose-1-phosphate uridylyltransferase